MRFLGTAWLRPATSSDQESYVSLEAVARAHDFPWPPMDPRLEASVKWLWYYKNKEVLAVVESNVIQVQGEKLRVGTDEQGTAQTYAELHDRMMQRSLRVAGDPDGDLVYHVACGQVWGVLETGEFNEAELEMLVVAAARKRVAEHEHQLETARRYLSNDGPTERQSLPDDVKMFVWRRDEGRCVKCDSRANLEFDHIIPLAMGGSNTERNLQLLCQQCNRTKGPRLY